MSACAPTPPNSVCALDDLLVWRRDVRHFRPDALPEGTIEELVARAVLAPSVGNSQPWRFVRVRAPARRARVREIFARANAAALASQTDEKAGAYARLKLAGLDDAPEHLAVFCDETETKGHGLGRATMPETLRYSVVCAVHTLWLAAQARALGVGWVSILDPASVARALETPADWHLIAYLCVGRPERESAIPELERVGWQSRDVATAGILER